jgi:excisionase family DNA binding protein
VLRRHDELTVAQVAKRFGVSPGVVYYWIERGHLQARKVNAGSPYWITINESDEQKLQGWVRNSDRIHIASPKLIVEGAI